MDRLSYPILGEDHATIQAGRGSSAWWEASMHEAEFISTIVTGLALMGFLWHAWRAGLSLAVSLIRCCAWLGQVLSGAVRLAQEAYGWFAVTPFSFISVFRVSKVILAAYERWGAGRPAIEPFASKAYRCRAVC